MDWFLPGESALEYYARTGVVLSLDSNASVKDIIHMSAREAMIEKHMGLVRYVGNKFYNSGSFERGDVFGYGFRGLVKAVDGYDPLVGVRFATFAVPTIFGEIQKGFRDESWLVRPTRPVQNAIGDINSGRVALDDFDPGMQADIRLVDKLNLPFQIDGDEHGYAEYHHVDAYPFLTNDMVMTYLDQLPLRNRMVMVLYYVNEQSQSEIAKQLGISQMQISRIINRSRGLLRRSIAMDGYCYSDFVE